MNEFIHFLIVLFLTGCTFVYVTDSEVGVETNDNIRVWTDE